MHRGLDVGIHLRPDITDDNFIAEALGNLAAFRLGNERHERLLWQVLRVQASGGKHHYRIVLRHPDRVLDLGFKSDLEQVLETISGLSEDQLRDELRAAEKEGLQLVKLRLIHQEVDYWRDDFWNWLG